MEAFVLYMVVVSAVNIVLKVIAIAIGAEPQAPGPVARAVSLLECMVYVGWGAWLLGKI